MVEAIPFNAPETIYYIVVFVSAFSAGVSQTLRPGYFKRCRHSINIGLVSGFLGFAVVAYFDGHYDDRVGNEYEFVALAVAVGLMTKYHEEMITALWEIIKKKLGYTSPIETQCEESGSASPNHLPLPPVAGGSVDPGDAMGEPAVTDKNPP